MYQGLWAGIKKYVYKQTFVSKKFACRTSFFKQEYNNLFHFQDKPSSDILHLFLTNQNCNIRT